MELVNQTVNFTYLMQDREEFPHSDHRRPTAGGGAGVGGRGELLPDGAPVLLGQEEPYVGAGLQLGLGDKLIHIS